MLHRGTREVHVVLLGKRFYYISSSKTFKRSLFAPTTQANEATLTDGLHTRFLPSQYNNSMTKLVSISLVLQSVVSVVLHVKVKQNRMQHEK